MGSGNCLPFWQLNYDNLWSVSIQGGGAVHPEPQKDSAVLSRHRSQSVELALPRNREIAAGEKYSVTATSREACYLTLLQANARSGAMVV